MKHILKIGIFLFIFGIISANAYIFVTGIQLSNELSMYESETKKLYTANMDLENKVYALDSLKFASSIAAQLNFSEAKEPLYLNGPNYARR